MNSLNCLIILACIYYNVTESYKVLLVFPYPFRSHANLGDAYMKHLLNAGHEITYVTPYAVKIFHENLTVIDVSSNLNLNTASVDIDMAMKTDLFDVNIIFAAVMCSTMYNTGSNTIHVEGVRNLLRDPKQKFEVVIAEWLYSELYAGFAEIFDAPLIWAVPVEPPWMGMALMDEAPNPAYTTEINSANAPPLDFYQRASQLWTKIKVDIAITITNIFESYPYTEVFGEAAKIRGKNLRPINEVRFNASMLLSNSHPALGEPTRLPHNAKYIGGFHVDFESIPLPDDLQKLMDSSKDGVIFFSLGSKLKSNDLPQEVKKYLITILSHLNQTVIWKFDHDPDAVLPKNVHIMNWAPQASILAHPNCILFISHGGLLSLIESIYNGVPVIGIPCFGDQMANVIRATQKGYAILVKLSLNLAADLEHAVTEIFTNSSYTENAKYRSMIFRDRVVSPGKELVFWVEHVVKTGGATYLRSHALSLAWYQKMYLDLLILVLGVVLVLFYIIQLSLRLKKIKTS